MNGHADEKMTSGKRNTIGKRVRWTLLIGFGALNIIACFHAYKFTHFSRGLASKTATAAKLTTMDKLKSLIFGVSNPRPRNTNTPSQKFETVNLSSNKIIECWDIHTEKAKGTVILFHGYGGEKSSMLGRSDEFIKQGYNTLLVDFMGSGGSEGDQTTIGYYEAQEVKTCYDYLVAKGEKDIYLFGTSMGAVAILKSMNDYGIEPKGIMLECPFGSLYKTVCARFHSMSIPDFPMAGLLVFWGGAQNGFWAFGVNPEKYAKSVKCPALLIYGEKDDKVSREEIEAIYGNLHGKKTLRIYPLAGHGDYLENYRQDWDSSVTTFLGSNTR